jgi:NAD-dependent dihydropyrimidine dehydrogenase PreA subunit
MSELKSRGFVRINIEECKGCELCIEACPQDVLFLSDSFNTHGYHPSTYKGEGCTGCGICFYCCPEPGAIIVFKRWDLMTEKAWCPHCKAEHKVFARDTEPTVKICTQCLQAIE